MDTARRVQVSGATVRRPASRPASTDSRVHASRACYVSRAAHPHSPDTAHARAITDASRSARQSCAVSVRQQPPAEPPRAMSHQPSATALPLQRIHVIQRPGSPSTRCAKLAPASRKAVESADTGPVMRVRTRMIIRIVRGDSLGKYT